MTTSRLHCSECKRAMEPGARRQRITCSDRCRKRRYRRERAARESRRSDTVDTSLRSSTRSAHAAGRRAPDPDSVGDAT